MAGGGSASLGGALATAAAAASDPEARLGRGWESRVGAYTGGGEQTPAAGRLAEPGELRALAVCHEMAHQCSAEPVMVDSDGFPNIDSYWAHHLPLRDHTNKAAGAGTLAKPQPAGAVQVQYLAAVAPTAAAVSREQQPAVQQRKRQEEARQEVQHYWSSYQQEEARLAAAQRATEARQAAKLKAQEEAAARAAAKIAAQTAAVQAARHAALEQAVSLSVPAPLGEETLTNNAGRSPMVPKSQRGAVRSQQHRSANTMGASSMPTRQAASATYARDTAVAAMSKPVLERDSTQVAELAGRSPVHQKSRGRSASASVATAPARATTATRMRMGVAPSSGLPRPAQLTEAFAQVVAKADTVRKNLGVSVAIQATDLPEPAAVATPASRAAVQQRTELQSSSSSNTNSSLGSKGNPSRLSVHAWGRTPVQRPNMSQSAPRHTQQSSFSSDSESDDSADDAGLQDDSRIFSEHNRQGNGSGLPTRAHRPTYSNVLKPIQARIGKV